MFRLVKKKIVTTALVVALLTSFIPSRVCTITHLCPVRQAEAQMLGGGGGGIMNMIMMLMMMMMVSQMASGKQANRAVSANQNLSNVANQPTPAAPIVQQPIQGIQPVQPNNGFNTLPGQGINNQPGNQITGPALVLPLN
jgi:hypothetical protein